MGIRFPEPPPAGLAVDPPLGEPAAGAADAPFLAEFLKAPLKGFGSGFFGSGGAEGSVCRFDGLFMKF